METNLVEKAFFFLIHFFFRHPGDKCNRSAGNTRLHNSMQHRKTPKQRWRGQSKEGVVSFEEKVRSGSAGCKGSRGVSSLGSSDEVIMHSSGWGNGICSMKSHSFSNGWKTLECNTETLTNNPGKFPGAAEHLFRCRLWSAFKVWHLLVFENKSVDYRRRTEESVGRLIS